MSYDKSNPYLDTYLRQLMSDETEVDVVIKLPNMTMTFRGTVIGVAVNDRNPCFTLRTLHKGQIKNNVVALNNFATINHVEEETE